MENIVDIITWLVVSVALTFTIVLLIKVVVQKEISSVEIDSLKRDREIIRQMLDLTKSLETSSELIQKTIDLIEKNEGEDLDRNIKTMDCVLDNQKRIGEVENDSLDRDIQTLKKVNQISSGLPAKINKAIEKSIDETRAEDRADIIGVIEEVYENMDTLATAIGETKTPAKKGKVGRRKKQK